MSSRRRIAFNRPRLFVLAGLLLLVGAGSVVYLVSQPRVVLLAASAAAQWIRVDRPLEVRGRTENTSVRYLIRFRVDHSIDNAVLNVAALRRVIVRLDGSMLFDSGPDLDTWKTTRAVQMQTIAAGSHELRFDVSNIDGPSLLRVSCRELGIATDHRWLAGADGENLKSAALASDVWEPVIPPQLQPQATGLVALPIAAGVIFALVMLLRRETSETKTVWAARVHGLLLIAWFVLSVNNYPKVEIGCGYDAKSHYRYIEFVAKNLSLPRPDRDWQSFQSPLYYIMSAGVYRLLSLAGASLDSVQYLLRWVPLLSGLAILEISWRAGRMVFPMRGDLQIITMLVGGLAPVNLYMAQTVSNEPMAAALSGIVFLIIVRMLQQPAWAVRPMSLVIAGLALGLAFLTKINALIWTVLLGIAIAMAVKSQKANWIRSVALAATGALTVSGWMLIRNYYLVGKPFYLESSVANQQWWQDPGYRTPNNFFEFGHVFTRPVYNGMASVWDSLYGSMWGNSIVVGRVPWNMQLMWIGLWLAIVPMLGIAMGMVRSIVESKNTVFRVSTLAVMCFTAAIVYVYLKLPIYSCAKASYLLGAMPCVGLLAASGLEFFMRSRWTRSIVGGLIVAWTMTAYLTFWAP